MASLIHFRAMPGMWLESACNVDIFGDLWLVCGLYDCIEAAGSRIWVRWVYILDHFLFAGKAQSSSTHMSPLIWILPKPIGGGYVSVSN